MRLFKEIPIEPFEERVKRLEALSISKKEIDDEIARAEDVYGIAIREGVYENIEGKLGIKDSAREMYVMPENIKEKFKPFFKNGKDQNEVTHLFIIANRAKHLMIDEKISIREAIIRALYEGSRLLRYHIDTIYHTTSFAKFKKDVTEHIGYFYHYLFVLKLLTIETFPEKINFEKMMEEFKKDVESE